MNLVLIGAGNVAFSMGPALVEAGFRVAAVTSRDGQSARELAGQLKTGKDILTFQGVEKLAVLPKSEFLETVCIAMLKDDALFSLAPDIVKALGTGALFLHTAGSVPAEVWKNAGAEHYGVIYPMASFSKSAPVSMRGVPVFVEASDRNSLDIAMRMAHAISDSVTELDSQGRLYLHLAAVFASNFSCRMMAISSRILERHGVDFKVMLPLIRGTVAKLEHLTPEESQTGPAVRGDSGVVSHHLEMLADNPGWQTLYRLISEDINPNIQIDD